MVLRIQLPGKKKTASWKECFSKIIALHCLNFSQIGISYMPGEACALYIPHSLWPVWFSWITSYLRAQTSGMQRGICAAASDTGAALFPLLPLVSPDNI